MAKFHLSLVLTHPVFAALDHPLYGSAIKRVKKKKLKLTLFGACARGSKSAVPVAIGKVSQPDRIQCLQLNILMYDHLNGHQSENK